jgi:hypothetical protein
MQDVSNGIGFATAGISENGCMYLEEFVNTQVYRIVEHTLTGANMESFMYAFVICLNRTTAKDAFHVFGYDYLNIGVQGRVDAYS